MKIFYLEVLQRVGKYYSPRRHFQYITWSDVLVAYNIHQGPSNPINIYQIAPTDSENKLRVGKRNISLAIINPISLQSSSVATQRSHSPIVQVHNVVQPPARLRISHPPRVDERVSLRERLSLYSLARLFRARQCKRILTVTRRRQSGKTGCNSFQWVPPYAQLVALVVFADDDDGCWVLDQNRLRSARTAVPIHSW